MKKIILIFVIAFVLLCQISAGAEETSADQRYRACFSGNNQLFTINATSGQHGNITPSGSDRGRRRGDDNIYRYPRSRACQLLGRRDRYVVWNITVDGQVIEDEPSLEPVNYTFSDVNASHTIHAEFTEMIIDARPRAKFEANKTSGFAPLTTHFSQTSVSNHTRVEWSFGDNSTSVEENPNHTYILPGSYTVAFTIWCDENESFHRRKGELYFSTEPLSPDRRQQGLFHGAFEYRWSTGLL